MSDRVNAYEKAMSQMTNCPEHAAAKKGKISETENIRISAHKCAQRNDLEKVLGDDRRPYQPKCVCVCVCVCVRTWTRVPNQPWVRVGVLIHPPTPSHTHNPPRTGVRHEAHHRRHAPHKHECYLLVTFYRADHNTR